MKEDTFKKWKELESRKSFWGNKGLEQWNCDKIQELENLDSQGITALPSGQSIREVKEELERDLWRMRNP